MKIANVKAREILDSRGNPTVEAEIVLENGIIARASVPSGASTGAREALELRDNTDRFNGRGVLKAVNNIKEIIRPKLIGMNIFDQAIIDKMLIDLDGTENKSKLGANALLAVSMACLKSASQASGKSLYQYMGSGTSLPIPMMNILNGGVHADNELAFQEFMIIPNALTIKERIRIGCEVFNSLKKILKSKGYNTNVGDEGGFAPNLKTTEEALDMILEAIKASNYIPGMDVNIALDVAASSFFEEGSYKCDNKKMTTDELIVFYEQLCNKYPIISIEDPVDENDWDGFSKITEKLGQNIQIVGDDLFVTNPLYLKKGIDSKAGNAILIKLNQIGTVTETIQTIEMAKKYNYKTIISHRSGETEDTFIADMAVGLNLGQIKTGSLSRTDRTCKYNQLIRIEEELEN